MKHILPRTLRASSKSTFLFFGFVLLFPFHANAGEQLTETEYREFANGMDCMVLAAERLAWPRRPGEPKDQKEYLSQAFRNSTYTKTYKDGSEEKFGPKCPDIIDLGQFNPFAEKKSQAHIFLNPEIKRKLATR